MTTTTVIKIEAEIYITLEENETIEDMKQLTLEELVSLSDYCEWRVK